MMGTGGIQIQAVLYRNDPTELQRAIRAIDSAAVQAGAKGWSVSLVWGDASETPVFPGREWDAVKKAGPHLANMEYRFFQENTGYGKGNNLLAAGSGAEYLLIMNPEIILSPNAIVDLLAPFEDSQTGITEARQLPVEHPKEYDRKTGETEWASGACFMIPAKLFGELNGFDTKTFFMYCEDVDLSWRVRLSGRKVIYQPLAGAFHPRRLSTGGRNQASSTEMKYTVLSEALLAYKWSYPDYARERIRLAAERRDLGSEEAMQLFREMEQKGELPDMKDPEHRVAHIIQYPQNGGMLFARHRFQL